MFQLLTKKIDKEIYMNDNNEKKKIKNNLINKFKNESEKELNEVLIEKEDDNIYKNEDNFSIFNIEIKVANNEEFRQNIPLKFENKKKYSQFIELMKKCWKHNPSERPNFYEITLTLQEIFEN